MDEQLTALIADAYEHLYDLVYLRTHALMDVLTEPDMPRKERAWQVHRLLLAALDELSPGPQAPVFSREWRRHRLMTLRYVDGLDPQAVSDQLSISRRHYYRELEAAVMAVSTIFQQRYEQRWRQYAAQEQVAGETDHADLLRVEAQRAASTTAGRQLGPLLRGIGDLLQPLMEAHHLTLVVDLAPGLPSITCDSTLLRQLLLALLSYLIDHAADAAVGVTGREEGATVSLALRVDPYQSNSTAGIESATRLEEIHEVARLCGAELFVDVRGSLIAGAALLLPTTAQRVVLTVDDNQDMLALLQRYLAEHSYSVVVAHTVAEALALARQQRPFAVITDIMMPDRDGWDLLQALRHDPTTSDVPVIICSVLRQQELALALGAAAHIEKPIREDDLLRVLAALEPGTSSHS